MGVLLDSITFSIWISYNSAAIPWKVPISVPPNTLCIKVKIIHTTTLPNPLQKPILCLNNNQHPTGANLLTKRWQNSTINWSSPQSSNATIVRRYRFCIGCKTTFMYMLLINMRIKIIKGQETTSWCFTFSFQCATTTTQSFIKSMFGFI